MKTKNLAAPATVIRLALVFILSLSVLRDATATELTASAELTDPYQILHKHYEAIGGLDRLQKLSGSSSEGRVRYDSLQGTFKHWDARPQQYRTEEDYSVISQVQGDNGEYTWFFDTNGQLLIFKDEDTLKRRRISLLLDRYEHLDPHSPFFSVRFGGTTTIDGKTCYELVLTNTINSDVGHFFYDTGSLLMVRSVYKQPDMETHSTYGDYREIDGFMISFYQHSLFLPWEKEEETWVTRHTFDGPADTTFFNPPAIKKDYTFLDGGKSATVSFRLMENLIYLPVTVGDDTGYWVLDSGASMSLIDHDYAEKLGLDIQGSIKGYGFGDIFDLSFVTIPEHQVGPILFDSQKFYVSRGLTAKSYEPQIFGILGYDFLSRFVVEVDYDEQEVTFHSPDTFSYKGSGAIIDAPLKYRTFTLPVILDGKYSSRWSVDLGSYHSSIHYPFAEKHGLLEKKGVEIVSQGMSGISRETNVRFDCLEIDGFRLDQPLISIPDEKGKGATALGEVGGNLGNSTLRHFRLFLNYPEQKLILEEGLQYKTAFPPDRSGLLIGRSDENQPMVSFLANDSPAARAGLEAGDTIVEMAGQQVKPNQTILPLRDILRGAVGSKVDLKVKRGDQVVAATIVLQDLYPASGQKCSVLEN